MIAIRDLLAPSCKKTIFLFHKIKNGRIAHTLPITFIFIYFFTIQVRYDIISSLWTSTIPVRI